MAQDNVVDMAKTTIVSSGSVAWLPAAFGYGLMDVAGQTAGVMLATGLAIAGAYNLAEKFGLTE